MNGLKVSSRGSEDLLVDNPRKAIIDGFKEYRRATADAMLDASVLFPLDRSRIEDL
jgi:hypothetical protein